VKVMFLNRIEVVGFKSFAERINIDFVPGITAVVGPNGSGKSNIIDAIRWVLGEQSAKSLRGQKMEDIIFQGSDSRKQLNFAEVSLILNNESARLPIDYNEVVITRRVYRSGESEFLINKQACRLKDIVDLFTDTGLGRESFSIIGQGKIDDILSSKAEERRAIFEEAAGVLKYKQRKSKAVFKLEETEDNLNRVEDIIYEIDQQLEPLKKQSDTAKTYKVKKAELESVEIALLVTEIEQLNDQWKSILAEIEAEKLVEIEKKTNIQDQEAKVTEKKHILHELDEAITRFNEQLLHATEKLENLEGKRNVYFERQKHFLENEQSLKANHTTVLSKISTAKADWQKENDKKTAIDKQINELNQNIASLNNKLQYGAEQINEQIEHLKSDYIEFLNEQAVLQNESKSIDRQLEQLKHIHTDQKHENKSLLENKSELENQFKTMDKQVNNAKKVINNKQKEHEEFKLQLLNEQKIYEKMQEKLYKGNEQIATLRARQETLEEMRKSFQGYFYGVKEVLKAANNNILQNIDGTVVDLINVDPSYVEAIDTILGGQAQHIIVRNEEAARKAINWLKKEKKGRATFLPIQSLVERQIPSGLLQQLKSQDGFIDVAANLVQAEDKFKRVVHHLMGNVIVTDTLANANKLAAMTNRKFRVVTLDGDIVFPGGSMSGGTKKQTNQSLFTRDKELTLLNEKINDFQNRAENFAEKVNNQKVKIEEMREKNVTLESSIIDLKDTLQHDEAKHREIAINLNIVVDDLSSYHHHQEQYDADVKSLSEEKSQLTETLLSLTEKITNTETEIQNLTEEEQEIKHSERQFSEQLQQFNINKAELDERKKNVVQRLKDINDQLEGYEEEQTSIENQLKQMYEEKNKELTEAEMTEEINEMSKLKDSAQASLEEKRSERQKLTAEIEDDEREIKQLEKQHEKLAKEIQQKEVKATRLDVALENNLSHLQSEYVTTFEKAASEHERVEDMDVAKKEVRQIKLSIESLGTVNLGAIEEYERLFERYEFLSEQKQDLLEAKQTLFDVIAEMDEEMIKRFGGMFAEIQLAFTDVFKKLFGGGDAYLKLTDEDNLLETGIDIIARPPGKKQKALSLLSGGERALTAIALLFAILKVKPVPFCILDEVDASLDEANVMRFSQYLNRYRDGSQFIVITHRKGTMEEADVLYGVTMQESGVSRLVSVRLEDMNELVEAT